MRPSKQTLFELFDRQRRYSVPLFQRPYVWSLEEQWEPLWEDIAGKCAELRAKNPREVAPHFLGAVVLEQVRTFGKAVDTAHVIDGQQRLTTFQVLLAAFRDIVATTHERGVADELRRLTENGGLRSEETEIFKVWPTNADRAEFSAVLRAGGLTALEESYPAVYKRKKLQPRAPLVEAYVYFHSRIAELVRLPTGADVEVIGTLFEVIKRNLELVVIELEESDDAQVIFETLNARGAPLLPSDLVRNFVFLNATRQGKDASALYERWWREFDDRKPKEALPGQERFWKIEQKQGRINRPRLDLFFIHYVTCRTGEEIPATRLFDEFRKYWKSAPDRDTESELQAQQRYAAAFASLLEPDVSTRVGRFARRLEVIDTSTVYPLLLHLLVEASPALSRADLDQIVVDVESFLVRRMVCGLTTKNYNRLFLTLLRQVREAGPAAAQRAREALLSGTGEAVKWPDDREFERAWLTTPVYAWLKPFRVAMILRALEDDERSAKRERIEILQKLSVEHVMPQSWHEHWGHPNPSLATAEESADEHRDRLLHTFGNLTLLTQELNVDVSNGPYDRKRVEIADKSALRLNAWFQRQSAWDEAEIVTRGKALLEVAMRVWPRP